jgi:hypothetical protein
VAPDLHRADAGFDLLLDGAIFAGAPFNYRRHWMKAPRLNLAVTDGQETLSVRPEQSKKIKNWKDKMRCHSILPPSASIAGRATSESQNSEPKQEN